MVSVRAGTRWDTKGVPLDEERTTVLYAKLLTTKVLVSMVAIGSLAATGAGVAGANAQTATQPVGHRPAPGQQFICRLFRAHTEAESRNHTAYALETAKIRILADEARKLGHIKQADHRDSVVVLRHAILRERDAKLSARKIAFHLENAKVGRIC